MIEVSHIGKRFRKTEVLKDVSIVCEPGKVYGIVGYNGSGKSVLFKCICGFLRCDSGEIKINGKVLGKDIDMIENAGILIEEPGFLRKSSGFNNLEFLYTIRNKPNKEHVKQVMRTVGLDPELKRNVGKYSLGMRQRLAIAQAIMEDPDILILDEPLNGLDKKGMEEMRELFLQMRQKGKTILLASHSREDIKRLCDYVYEIDHGELKQIFLT